MILLELTELSNNYCRGCIIKSDTLMRLQVGNLWV
ncbi:MAG: zinc-finger domain-containing protein [Bacteroidales bacterium]